MNTAFQDSFYRWLVYFSPYLRLGEFIVGCLVAQLYMALRGHKIAPWEARTGAVLQLVGVSSIVFLLYLIYRPSGGPAWLMPLASNIGMAPPIALLIFCGARYQTLFTRFLAAAPIVALGDASYSIYLLHPIFF